MAFAPNWSGKQIGDFLIEAPIGRGGMAMVYSARQRSVDRQVALKIIDLQPGDDTDFLKRFTREAEVIAMLEHIHILPVYGYGVLQDEAAYFAMRLLRHGSLADLLRQGALPLDDAVDLFAQIASGLQYMHSRGVIHRDLKPSNILLDENGNAYLSDFGLARMTDVTVNISEQAFHTAGTPAYLAPELIDGKVADPLSDIYSLGVLLYQMLCGCLPFQAEEGGISALLYKHMREPPPPMHLINPAVPPAVEAVVMRALSKNRRERFASADEMAYELRSATLGSSTSVPRARALVSGLLPRSARQRRVFFGGLFIFCLIAFLAAFALTQKNSSPPMNVLAGAHAGSADLTLTDGEIALAHARLGVSGFVAYFPCTMSDAFQTTVARELSDEASQDGLLLRLYDSQDDPARLLTLIEQARLEGAKAFILCPLGEPLLDDTIRSLQSATIPLVLALDYDSTYGVKVELDNEAVGQVQGRYAGEILLAEHEGHGTVVVLSMMEVAAGRGAGAGDDRRAARSRAAGGRAGSTERLHP